MWLRNHDCRSSQTQSTNDMSLIDARTRAAHLVRQLDDSILSDHAFSLCPALLDIGCSCNVNVTRHLGQGLQCQIPLLKQSFHAESLGDFSSDETVVKWIVGCAKQCNVRMTRRDCGGTRRLFREKLKLLLIQHPTPSSGQTAASKPRCRWIQPLDLCVPGPPGANAAFWDDLLAVVLPDWLI